MTANIGEEIDCHFVLPKIAQGRVVQISDREDGILRNEPSLLNTRILSSMVTSRFFFLGLIALFGIGLVRGQDTPADPTAVKKATMASAEPRISFNSIHVDGPYIAMTFDDGPNEKLTPKLLDLLAAHHIKATFFVIGQNVAENPQILARAAREGHEIGNHTWSHPNLAKMSDEGVRREIRRTDELIKDTIGTRPTLMRPPYGSLSTRQKRLIHDEFGYQIILWDVDPLDWKRPGPTVVCNRILKETRAGSIVLSHDIHPGTIEAMPATFSQLEAKGFKFITVSELIGMATPEPPKPTATPRAQNPPRPAARSTTTVPESSPSG